MGPRCLTCGITPPWKKAKVIDMFGPWKPHDELMVASAAFVSVPSVKVPRDDVLLMNVELDADSLRLMLADAVHGNIP